MIQCGEPPGGSWQQRLAGLTTVPTILSLPYSFGYYSRDFSLRNLHSLLSFSAVFSSFCFFICAIVVIPCQTGFMNKTVSEPFHSWRKCLNKNNLINHVEVQIHNILQM